MIENAKVVQADIVCANGVIHVIDVVLIPKVVYNTSSLNSSRSNIYRNRTNSTNPTQGVSKSSIAVGDSTTVNRPAIPLTTK